MECYAWAALSQWFLGKADQALLSASRALEIAQHPAQSYALANALAQLAVLYQFRREPHIVIKCAEQTIELGQQQGIVYRVALGHALRGWARVALGEGEGGLNDIRKGIEVADAIGAKLDRPYLLALLAESLMALGRTHEAKVQIDAALTQVAQGRSFFYQAEVWRLQAVALARIDAPSEAVKLSLKRALDAAQDQGAKSLELRTHLSMHDICANELQRRQACGTIRTVFDGFDEGFDTPDLLRARSILEEYKQEVQARTSAVSAALNKLVGIPGICFALTSALGSAS